MDEKSAKGTPLARVRRPKATAYCHNCVNTERVDNKGRCLRCGHPTRPL